MLLNWKSDNLSIEFAAVTGRVTLDGETFQFYQLWTIFNLKPQWMLAEGMTVIAAIALGRKAFQS